MLKCVIGKNILSFVRNVHTGLTKWFCYFAFPPAMYEDSSCPEFDVISAPDLGHSNPTGR